MYGPCGRSMSGSSPLINNAIDSRVSLCAGMPLVGTRDISFDERGTLSRHRLRALKHAWLLGTGPWVAAFAFFAALAIIQPIPMEMERLGEALAMATVGVILCLIFVVPFTWIRVWHKASLARSIGRSLRCGKVDAYQGVLCLSDPTDRVIPVLVDLGGLRLGRCDVNSVELLSGASMVFSINKSPVKLGHTVRVTRAVPRPDQPVFLERSTRSDAEDDRSCIGRRRLTPEEIAELSGYARRQTIDAILPSLFTMVIVLLVARRMMGGTFPWSPVLLGGICIIAGWRILRSVYLIPSTTRRDAHAGWVVCSRQSESDAGEGAGILVENLPHSGAVWTVDEQPAAWRGHP